MRIDLEQIAGKRVLAGALNGKALLTRLLENTMSEPVEPEPLFLNFAGIDVATASYLRESILALRDIIRHRRSNYYPVIANANDAVLDELAELAKSRGDVMMTCVLDTAGNVLSTTPLGTLDPKQQITFDRVQERGETDAGELMRLYGKSEGLTHSTAWNNRLASLAGLGLIVELSRGRSKRYRPLFAGV
jgi:hypothetical protein